MVSRHKISKFFGDYPLKRYEKDQILFFPGEAFKHLLYVESGIVRVYDVTLYGNEVVVNIFVKNSIFPISKILNKTHNNYFYQAYTALNIRQAEPEDFILFLAQNPDVMLHLLKNGYLDAQNMRRRMAHLMGGSAANRLLYELVFQSQIFGEMSDDGSYLIPITETELGARSGLSRETVSRMIKPHKDSDSVSVLNNGIKITDMKQLERELGQNL
jgi:CRP/FNR family transcriptional regulator, cyclic AMP receptor protein